MPKKKYELAENEEVAKIIGALIREHHDHLREVSIAVLWVNDVRPDADGIVWLGKMGSLTEKYQLLTGFDALLELNRVQWVFLEPAQKLAVIDHELAHLDFQRDENGFPKVDGHGNFKMRTRKHPVEEFPEIVARHGAWTDTLKLLKEHARKKPLYEQKKLDLGEPYQPLPRTARIDVVMEKSSAPGDEPVM